MSCTEGRCEGQSVLVREPDAHFPIFAARLHSVGARFTGRAFLGFAGRCAPLPEDATQGLWQLGPEMAWDDRFPRLDEWLGNERVGP